MTVQEIKKTFGIDITSNKINSHQKRAFKHLFIEEKLKEGLSYLEIDKLLSCSRYNSCVFYKKGVSKILFFDLIRDAYENKSKKKYEYYLKVLKRYDLNNRLAKYHEYRDFIKELKETKTNVKPLNMQQVLFILEPHRKTKKRSIKVLWDKRLDLYSEFDWNLLRSLNPEYFDKHLIN